MEMLSYKQASEFLGIPVETLYGLVCRRQIPHYRYGRRFVRFRRDELEQWILARRVSARE